MIELPLSQLYNYFNRVPICHCWKSPLGGIQSNTCCGNLFCINNQCLQQQCIPALRSSDTVDEQRHCFPTGGTPENTCCSNLICAPVYSGFSNACFESECIASNTTERLCSPAGLGSPLQTCCPGSTCVEGSCSENEAGCISPGATRTCTNSSSCCGGGFCERSHSDPDGINPAKRYCYSSQCVPSNVSVSDPTFRECEYSTSSTNISVSSKCCDGFCVSFNPARAPSAAPSYSFLFCSASQCIPTNSTNRTCYFDALGVRSFDDDDDDAPVQGLPQLLTCCEGACIDGLCVVAVTVSHNYNFVIAIFFVISIGVVAAAIAAPIACVPGVGSNGHDLLMLSFVTLLLAILATAVPQWIQWTSGSETFGTSTGYNNPVAFEVTNNTQWGLWTMSRGGFPCDFDSSECGNALTSKCYAVRTLAILGILVICGVVATSRAIFLSQWQENSSGKPSAVDRTRVVRKFALYGLTGCVFAALCFGMCSSLVLTFQKGGNQTDASCGFKAVLPPETRVGLVR